MTYSDLEFYYPWPEFGQKLSRQWRKLRTNQESLASLVRAAEVDVATVSGEHDLAGWAIGELDFRNRYRIFYYKGTTAGATGDGEYQIQVNRGTELVPDWYSILRIRDSDYRVIVQGDGGFQSLGGFYAPFDIAGAFGPGFYGNVVSNTSESEVYTGIESFGFDDDHFYLNQNATDTDRVTIHFKPGGHTSGHDHGGLTGLSDDDHTIYTKADGTRAFTGDQSMGSNKLTSLKAPTAASDAARLQDVWDNQNRFYGIYWRISGSGGATMVDDTMVFDANHFYLFGSSDGKPGLSLHQLQNLTTVQLSKMLHFTETDTPVTPGANQICLHAEDQSGFSRLHYISDQGAARVICRDGIMIVRNNSGGTINEGQIVYLSGSTGNIATIAKAKADSTSTLPAAGVVINANINNNSFGEVLFNGCVQQFDGSGFSEGDLVYVSAATAGSLTATAPTHPNFAQQIGVVTKATTSGVLHVNITETHGDESGATNATFTVGATAAASSILSTSGISAQRTHTLPNLSGTLALIDQVGPGFYDILFKESESGGATYRDDTLVFDSYFFYLPSDGSGKPILSSLQRAAGAATRVQFASSGVTLDSAADFLYRTTNQVQIPLGALTAPGLVLSSSELDTGLYRSGSDNLSFAAAGTQIAGFSASGFRVHGGNLTNDNLIVNAVGSVGAPTYTFTGHTTSGIYSTAGGAIGLVASGSELLRAIQSTPDRLLLAAGAYDHVGIGLPYATGVPKAKLHVHGDIFVENDSVTAAGFYALGIDIADGVVRTSTLELADPGSSNNIYSAANSQVGVSVQDNKVVWGTELTSNAMTLEDSGGIDKLYGNNLVFQAYSGTVSAPSFADEGDENTGIYFPDDDIVGIATGGKQAARFTRDKLVVPGGFYSDTLGEPVYSTAGQVLLPYGSNSAPALAWISDTDTGIYGFSAQIRAAIAGSDRLTITGSSITATVPYTTAGGSVGAPAYTITGDTDTGIWRSAADTLNIAAGGSEIVEFDQVSADFAVPVFAPNLGPAFYGIYWRVSGAGGTTMVDDTVIFDAAYFYMQGGGDGKPIVSLWDAPIAGAGQANTMSSAGGTSIYKEKVGVDLVIKGLTAGSGIALAVGADALTISALGGGGGFYGVYWRETESGGYVDVGDTMNFDSLDFYIMSDGSGRPVLASTRREIENLNNVTITGTPADNEVLAYDSTSGQWINQTASEAGFTTAGGFSSTTSVAAVEWVHTHNLGTNQVLWATYDEGNEALVPNRVDVSDPNVAYFYFGAAVAGRSVVAAGTTGISVKDGVNTYTGTSEVNFSDKGFYTSGDADGDPVVNLKPSPGGLVESLGGHIETVAVSNYVLDESAFFDYMVEQVVYRARTGTATLGFYIQDASEVHYGSSIIGLDPLSASTTQATAVASGSNTVSVGQRLVVSVPAESSSAGISFSVKTTRV